MQKRVRQLQKRVRQMQRKNWRMQKNQQQKTQLTVTTRRTAERDRISMS